MRRPQVPRGTSCVLSLVAPLLARAITRSLHPLFCLRPTQKRLVFALCSYEMDISGVQPCCLGSRLFCMAGNIKRQPGCSCFFGCQCFVSVLLNDVRLLTNPHARIMKGWEGAVGGGRGIRECRTARVERWKWVERGRERCRHSTVLISRCLSSCPWLSSLQIKQNLKKSKT